MYVVLYIMYDCKYASPENLTFEKIFFILVCAIKYWFWQQNIKWLNEEGLLNIAKGFLQHKWKQLKA